MTVNGQTDTDHTDTSAVANFYNHHAGSEHQRLALNSLEYELTLRIIRSVLGDTFQDKGLLNVADIGGGSGRYSIELAKLGHNVILSDISSVLLSLASASASSLPNLTVHPAISALSLRTTASNLYKRNHYNVILLLGPLYHLLHHTERVEVLSICKEMLRPGGVLISAFISRAGHLRRVALKEPKRLGAQWEGFYQEYLETGLYTRWVNEGGNVAYHVRGAQEIRELFADVGGNDHGGDRQDIITNGATGDDTDANSRPHAKNSIITNLGTQSADDIIVNSTTVAFSEGSVACTTDRLEAQPSDSIAPYTNGHDAVTNPEPNTQSSLEIIKIHGVQGFLGGMDGVFDTLDRESFLRWADVAEMYMDEADAGGSDHLVCVARKVLGGKDRQMDYEGGEEEIVKEEGRKEEGGKGMVNGVNTRGFSCEEG